MNLITDSLLTTYESLSSLRYRKFDLLEIVSLNEQSLVLLNKLSHKIQDRSFVQLISNESNLDEYIFENILNNGRRKLKYLTDMVQAESDIDDIRLGKYDMQEIY
jgi:hypothetical protein